MNISIKNNMPAYIDQMQPNLKRAVLTSLVGSLNASLVGSASSAVRRLKRDGYDMLDLSATEVTALLDDPDHSGQPVRVLNNVFAVAQDWRDDLVALTDDNVFGSVRSTISFMAQPRKRKNIDDAMFKAVMESVEIDPALLDKGMIEAKIDEQNKHDAEFVSENQIGIEWMIDHVFCNPDIETGQYDQLPEDMRERLLNKLHTAIIKARDNAVVSVLTGKPFWSIGDLPVIQAALKEVQAEIES